MDYFLIAAVLSAVVIVVLSALVLRVSRPVKVVQAGGAKAGAGRAVTAGTLRARLKANARRAPAGAAAGEAAAGGEGEGGDEDREDAGGGRGEQLECPATEERMGAKKRAKLEAKAEKRQAREAEERAREERRAQQLQADEQRLQQERQQEEQERQQLLLLQKQEAERAERERREYEAMRAAFTVDAEGQEEPEGGEQDGASALQRFLQHVRDHKVVDVESVAARGWCGGGAAAAARALQQLSADNTLVGVLDERGRFVHVTEGELAALAAAVRARGRLPLPDLVPLANQLVRLTPLPAP